MSGPALAWDAFQREALVELGLRSYALAGAGAGEVVPAAIVREPGKVFPQSNANADALLRALARAASCEPSQIADWPELAGLRGDARAKRALWPMLRRLRAVRRATTPG